MKAAIRSILRGIWRDLYFSHTRAVWTDDPTYKVVDLRNKIIDLVENRISEVTGVTEPEEFYLLAPGDERYALARIRDKHIIEGAYFEQGWPGDLKSDRPFFSIRPQMLKIQGKPYKITKIEDPQAAQVILKVEN